MNYQRVGVRRNEQQPIPNKNSRGGFSRMKIHFVKFDFGNRIRLCDSRLNGEFDDTTDNISNVNCKKCLSILKKDEEDLA
jgi:hypothetical protein